MSPGTADGYHLTPVTLECSTRPLRAAWARTIQTNTSKSEGDGDKENINELSGGSWFTWQRTVSIVNDTHMEGGDLWSDPCSQEQDKECHFPRLRGLQDQKQIEKQNLALLSFLF